MKVDWKKIEDGRWEPCLGAYYISKKCENGWDIKYVKFTGANYLKEDMHGYTHYHGPIELPEPPEQPQKTVSFVEALRCVLDGGKAARLDWVKRHANTGYIYCENNKILSSFLNQGTNMNKEFVYLLSDTESDDWVIIEEAPKKQEDAGVCQELKKQIRDLRRVSESMESYSIAFIKDEMEMTANALEKLIN